MSNSEKSHQANLDRALFALSLDHGAGAPLQMQLIAALRRILLSSPHHAGARLPATRMLARELSVSRTTVQAAYDQLIGEGYLTARQGSGTFVADAFAHLATPPQRRATPRPDPVPLRPFETGQPDPTLWPHAVWARHLERAWRAPGADLLGRADPFGWYPLRAAIADHLAAWRHLDCNADQIVITSGAREALELICRGLLAPQPRVVIEDPGWPKTRDVLTGMGAQVFPVRIDEDGLDVGHVPATAAAVIVTPSRHYPTGRSLPLPRRLALLDWARGHGGLIVEDDYDSEFRYRGQPLPSLSGLDGLQHTAYLGSFSKLISPALRLGYIVLPRAQVAAALAYLRRFGAQASLIPQPALARFMDSGAFATHLRRMRRVYGQRQAHLVAALAPVADLLAIRPDAAGMHLCLPLRPELAARITDHRIAAMADSAGLDVGALSSHGTQPHAPQALLLGYAAFDPAALSAASDRLIALLRSV